MSANILIANRDAQQRQILRDWLELEGFQCTEVASGPDAVQQIVDMAPDVALIDNDLEQFDGIELLLHLRQDLTREDFPIMILSAGQRDDNVVSALELGATDFLPKPFSRSVVLARIRNALRIRNLQRRSNAQRIESKNISATQTSFLANISHEIRTPMTAILGFADLLYHEGDISRAPKHRLSAIQTIRRNADYLLKLVNDLLDLSKIESGYLDVERQRCSALEILDEVVSLLKIRAAKKQIELRVEYEENGVPDTVFSDSNRLRQILLNLISNAIKFTSEGHVHVRVLLDEPDDAEPMLRFEVFDTGIGMSPEQIQRVFKPFTQATALTDRQYGGTGLGLTISRQLARLLGGDIEVTSTPGEGSVFTLSIQTGSLEGVKRIGPAARAESQASELTANYCAFPRQLTSRVLLVEDGQDNQRLLSYILEKAGAEVMLADNGEVAVELALAAERKQLPFDVVLMDVELPTIGGLEVTRRLRAEGYQRTVIALTAHALAGMRDKCREAGCDDYIAKPIDRRRLIEIVKMHSARPKTLESTDPTDRSSVATILHQEATIRS